MKSNEFIVHKLLGSARLNIITIVWNVLNKPSGVRGLVEVLFDLLCHREGFVIYSLGLVPSPFRSLVSVQSPRSVLPTIHAPTTKSANRDSTFPHWSHQYVHPIYQNSRCYRHEWLIITYSHCTCTCNPLRVSTVWRISCAARSNVGTSNIWLEGQL